MTRKRASERCVVHQLNPVLIAQRAASVVKFPPRTPAAHSTNVTRLVERVGPGSPPGEEDGQADSLEELGGDASADGVEGPTLSEELGKELRLLLA